MRVKIGMEDDVGKQNAKNFFKNAFEYMHQFDDHEKFAFEVAYVMTTLHMHGV